MARAKHPPGTENEDNAAWLVATKAGLPLERVTVWAGRDSSS